MATIQINIEILDSQIDSNPFMEIGRKLQRQKEEKTKIEEANKKVKEVHFQILSEIKLNLIKKLEEAKIPYICYKVNHNKDLFQRNMFETLYGDFSFWLKINHKYLLVKLKPQTKIVEMGTLLDGKYHLYYTTKGNPEQMRHGMRHGNVEGWVEFTDSKVLEEEIIKIFN